MKAVDTNVLARFIINDHPAQAAIAAKQLREPSFASATVLLECAWLLSSRFKLDRRLAAAALQRILDLPAMNVRDPGLVAWAIERFAAGADFADMLHIVDAGQVDAFVTFEKHLARDAGPDAPLRIERLST